LLHLPRVRQAWRRYSAEFSAGEDGLWMTRKPLKLPSDMHAEVILGEKEHGQLGGDFEVAHVLFVAVRRPHTE